MIRAWFDSEKFLQLQFKYLFCPQQHITKRGCEHIPAPRRAFRPLIVCVCVCVCVCGVLASHPTVRMHHSYLWRLEHSALGSQTTGRASLKWQVAARVAGAHAMESNPYYEWDFWCRPNLWIWWEGLSRAIQCSRERWKVCKGFAFCSFNQLHRCFSETLLIKIILWIYSNLFSPLLSQDSRVSVLRLLLWCV